MLFAHRLCIMRHATRSLTHPIGTKPFRTTPHVAAKGIVALVLAGMILGLSAQRAAAQSLWRKPTPRDTIYVPASQKAWVRGHFPAPVCTNTKFSIQGTFGIFPGQDSTGFDARYMYSDTNWNAPYPLPNPPSWDGMSYQVYLQVSNDQLYSDADSIHVLESDYQPSHSYTALYPGTGDYFYFRIFNRINEDSTGADYALATGGLKITTAQFTAGVSVQKRTMNFPITNVGMTSTLLDSIASYGLDPLYIDSVWISGPQASEFGISSNPTAPFKLPNESAHLFAISYAPSQPDPQSTATLYIRCVNTGTSPSCDTEVVAIALSGSGAAPNGSFIQDTLDFGTERVNVPTKPTAEQGYNSGNGSFVITSCSIVPNVAFSCISSFPLIAQPENGFRVLFQFTPPTAQPYQSMATLSTADGKQFHVTLIGNGAKSNFIITQPTRNFDTLFTNDYKTLYDTVRNDGTWPAYITRVQLGGPQRQFYSFIDSTDVKGFILNPGESRYYSLIFHPTFGIANLKVIQEDAYLEFDFDDASQPDQITLNGYERRPTISYDTNILNFDTVEVGTDSTRSIGVYNASEANASLTATTLPPALVFTVRNKPLFHPDSDQLPITFHPYQHGPVHAWMHVFCNEQDDSIFVYGFGGIPYPLFMPPDIDFGVCNDGFPYYGTSSLTDTGDYPLVICDLKIVGPDASEFSLLPLAHTLPDTLHSGARDTITFPVKFYTTARAGRDHHATLDVLYCNGTMDTVPLVGSEANEFVQFCSRSVDFGKVRVRTTAGKTVCFYNSAPAVDLPTGPLWLVPGGTPFDLQQDSLLHVPPNGTSYDSIFFAPATRGTFTTWLHCGGGEKAAMLPDSMLITGIGAQSEPALSAHLLDFGTVPMLTTSGSKALFLQDTGDWPLLATAQKLDDPTNEFLVMTQYGDTVNPTVTDSISDGGSIFYSVQFTPRHPELPYHEAKLAFTYDDGSVDTVLLIGRDSANFVAFNRDTIDFGKVRVGTPPASQSLDLVNTSSQNLTVTALNQPTMPFSTNALPPTTIRSMDSATIRVNFQPQAMGFFQSTLSGTGKPFNDTLWNSVLLEGTGAMPKPVLSVDTLNFDTVAFGRSVTKTFTLSNLGNWPLLTSRAPMAGPNASDFTPSAIPVTDTLGDSNQVTYAVTYQASTPLQLTPRVGTLTWTLDDGSTFQLVLLANDVPPYKVQIGFPHAYWGRPGDKLSVELDLLSGIPDTLGIDSIRGTITFDPSIVDGPDKVPGGGVQPGNLVQTPAWTPNIVYHYGSFDYSLSSTSEVLSKPGTLLTFQLALHPNLQDGASSPLIANDTLPNTHEAIAVPTRTTIFLDSNCGTIHLEAGGAPIANFIRQNTPNPFSISTTLPFTVGDDNTMVTIRILDPTGREVLRPIDHQTFARGRYDVTVPAHALAAGIYFYEFDAGDAPPQMGKMAVE